MSDEVENTRSRSNRERRRGRVGEVYGRLTVVSVIAESGKRTVLACVCACGSGQREYSAYGLRCGKTQSCGCLQRERAAEAQTSHGARDTTEYYAWTNAKTRCFNRRNKSFKYYGGRGITMCERWRHSFESFLADMGPRPPSTMLDRINNDGNYEPGNCRWASRTDQNRNRRMNVRLTIPDGSVVVQSELAQRLGVTGGAIRRHRRQGDLDAWLAKKLHNLA